MSADSGAQAIGGVDHVTLRCAPAQLSVVRSFYENVIGLTSSSRPAFDFPGAWLYAGDRAIIHLAAVLERPMAVTMTPASSRPAASEATGYIDHFALRVNAPVSRFREKLAALNVPFSEAPVPGYPLHQIFLVDPLGVKVELNFELERFVQVTANGLSIGCAIRGSGAPLILMHGGEADHSMFDALAAELAADFTVIAYDQRDSGQTQDLTQPPRTYGLADAGDDAAALIEALGYRRAHVFGTSLGGHIAQVCAARHPDKVNKLILSSTWLAGSGLHIANPDVARQLGAWRQDVQTHAGDIAQLFFPPSYLAEHPERIEMFRTSRRTPQQNQRRSALIGTPYPIADGQIEADTLLLMGEADALIPNAASLAIARCLRRHEVRTMPGAPHVSAIHSPTVVARHVKEFLQS